MQAVWSPFIAKVRLSDFKKKKHAINGYIAFSHLYKHNKQLCAPAHNVKNLGNECVVRRDNTDFISFYILWSCLYHNKTTSQQNFLQIQSSFIIVTQRPSTVTVGNLSNVWLNTFTHISFVFYKTNDLNQFCQPNEAYTL